MKSPIQTDISRVLKVIQETAEKYDLDITEINDRIARDKWNGKWKQTNKLCFMH